MLELWSIRDTLQFITLQFFVVVVIFLVVFDFCFFMRMGPPCKFARTFTSIVAGISVVVTVSCDGDDDLSENDVSSINQGQRMVHSSS